MSVTLNTKSQRTAAVDEAVRKFLTQHSYAKPGETRAQKRKEKALERRKAIVNKWMKMTAAV
jgi:hypothetical protein